MRIEINTTGDIITIIIESDREIKVVPKSPGKVEFEKPPVNIKQLILNTIKHNPGVVHSRITFHNELKIDSQVLSNLLNELTDEDKIEWSDTYGYILIVEQPPADDMAGLNITPDNDIQLKSILLYIKGNNGEATFRGIKGVTNFNDIELDKCLSELLDSNQIIKHDKKYIINEKSDKDDYNDFTKERIINIIRDNPNIKYKRTDLSEKLGLDRSVINTLVNELTDEGKIEWLVNRFILVDDIDPAAQILKFLNEHPTSIYRTNEIQHHLNLHNEDVIDLCRQLENEDKIKIHGFSTPGPVSWSALNA